MAVQVGPIGTNAPDSVVTGSKASRGMLWSRLILWSGSIAVAFAVARLVLPSQMPVPPLSLLAIIFTFCGCAGLSAAIYLFATYAISRQTQHLFLAAGFFALSGGVAAQLIADARALSPANDEWVVTTAWLASALLFWGASRAESARPSESRLRSAVHVVVTAAMVLALPALLLPYALGATSLPFSYLSAGNGPMSYITEGAVALAALLVMIAAALGSYRRYKQSSERIAAINCYFFASCTFVLLARAVSAARFDAWWVCGQAQMVVSWCILAGAVAVENAIAHREAESRVAEMETLHGLSWSLVGAEGMHEVLARLAHKLTDELQASVCTVYLADEVGESLVVAASAGPDDYANEVGVAYRALSADRRPGFHTGHTAKAYLSGGIQVARDVFVDVEFIPWRMIAVDNGCAISLPLFDQHRPIGVLNLYFGDESKVTHQKLRLLATIAGAASPAIVNARTNRAEHPSDVTTEMDLAA